MKDAITIQFSFADQAVFVKCAKDGDRELVKTWEFARAVLSMANDFVDKQIKAGHVMQMQQAMQEQQVNGQLARKVMLGK